MKKSVLKTISIILSVIIFICSYSGHMGKVNAIESFYYILIESDQYSEYVPVDFGNKKTAIVKWGTVPKNVDDWSPYTNMIDNSTKTKLEEKNGKKLLGFGLNENDKKWGLKDTITVSKKNFVKDAEGDYVLRIYGVFEWKSEWVNGRWYNVNGVQNYSPRASWKGSNSYYWYEDTTGWYPISSWEMIDHKWYYFKEDGYAACNEWVYINEEWYHFNKSCSMDTNCWVGGYLLNDDGTQTYTKLGSWRCDSNGWYYMDEVGWYPMKEFVTIDGYRYYFKSDGYMACNETIKMQEIDDDGEVYTLTYKFDSNGEYTITEE